MKQTIQYFASIAAILTLCVSTPGVAFASWEATDAPEETPAAYTLSAAYPNPFNPSTTFTLSVQERQKVVVQVFNLLGQPVARLFDGLMQAGETRSFSFDAGSLPSGIYIYRITGERFTAARQMTLIK